MSNDKPENRLLCDRACITTQTCSGNCINPLEGSSLKHSSQPPMAVSLETMKRSWRSLQTNPALLAALKDASEPTFDEVREQFIGAVAADVNISKERVKEILGFHQREPIVPPGFAIMPVEPTPEIIQAMVKAWQEAVAGDNENECVAEYRAAVDVSIKQVPQNPQQLKDHEIRELVNKLTDVARKYHNTQQLRERIIGLVLPMFKRI